MITRRQLMGAGAVTFLSLLGHNQQALADVSLQGVSQNTYEDPVDRVRYVEDGGTYIIEFSAMGALRTTTIQKPDGSIECITYDTSDGVVSSSITGDSFITEKNSVLGSSGWRIPINPNPAFIVSGPPKRKTRYISYKQLKRTVGTMNDAASIAGSIGGILGFPFFSYMIGFITDNLGYILALTEDGDPNHGIKIKYSEIIRYYQNPATNHREYYDSQEQFHSITTY